MRSSLSPASLAALTLAALSACGGAGEGTSSTAASSGSSASVSTGSAGTAGTGGTMASGGTGGTGGGGGSAPLGEPYVYVGGYGNLIHVFHLGLADGSLTPVGMPVDAGANPSFLAVDPAHHTLLAVNEASGNDAAVASFQIDPKTGALTFLSRVGSHGDGPAHVATDPSGAFAFVANYGGGTVAVLPLLPGGMLGDAVDVHDQGGASANPHQTLTDAANAFAFVPNKGLDTVSQYAFDPKTGKLTDHGTLHLAAGAGPRHLAFHPTAPYAYLIAENDSTMSALSYDKAQGKLAVIQTVSMLPPGFQGQNTGAEVQVAPSGKFVYGSNRGRDTVVVFRVGADGKLTQVDETQTMGKTPRHFQIEPSGQILLVADQDSNSVVTFRVDPGAGTLTPTGNTAAVPSPSYAGVVYLAAP